MQVNRQIEGNPALDDVDHALGRPFDPRDTYRDHYATCCPDQIAEMTASPWWNRGVKRGDMVFFHVSKKGREALTSELSDHAKYGRVYEITARHHDGRSLVAAQSHSQAKYRAWVAADIDWPFIEYAKEINVRLAR